jgi:hypothetical protein
MEAYLIICPFLYNMWKHICWNLVGLIRQAYSLYSGLPVSPRNQSYRCVSTVVSEPWCSCSVACATIDNSTNCGQLKVIDVSIRAPKNPISRGQSKQSLRRSSLSAACVCRNLRTAEKQYKWSNKGVSTSQMQVTS